MLYSLRDGLLLFWGRYVVGVCVFYKQGNVIVLRALVVPDFSANRAFVGYDVFVLWIGCYGYGIHYSAAITRSVSGVDIEVQRAEAIRTMVTRCVA